MLVAASLAVTSCEKADLQTGGQYADDGYAQYTYVDSVSPVLSTVFIDSFATSGLGYGLLGNFTDPNFGKINSTSYFQLQPPTYRTTYTDSLQNAVYDSLTLLVSFDASRWYGDTLQTSQLSVYQLQQPILKYNNDSYLYNTQSFPTNATPIGSKTFGYRPTSGSPYDTLSIKLDNTLGQQLFDYLRSGNVNIQNADNFVSYFKGLKLVAGANTPGMGIKDSIIMRMHYRAPSSDNLSMLNKVTNFTIYNNTFQFNHIDIDRSGTVLANNNFGKNNKEVSSTLTGNQVYVQSVTGSVGKIAFPNLQLFNNLPGLYKLSKALLEIRPVRGTYENVYTLPSTLNLYQTDANNGFGIDPNGTSTHQSGSLSVDQYGSRYLFDVTSYVSTMMHTEFKAGDGLLIAPSSSLFATTFSSLVFGDGLLSGYQNIKLKLYFIQVNTNN